MASLSIREPQVLRAPGASPRCAPRWRESRAGQAPSVVARKCFQVAGRGHSEVGLWEEKCPGSLRALLGYSALRGCGSRTAGTSALLIRPLQLGRRQDRAGSGRKAAAEQRRRDWARTAESFSAHSPTPYSHLLFL